MHLNRSEILENIEIQGKRNDLQRGEQPLLTLTCFSGLKIEDTETFCESCSHYEKTCMRNLLPYRIQPTFYLQG